MHSLDSKKILISLCFTTLFSGCQTLPVDREPAAERGVQAITRDKTVAQAQPIQSANEQLIQIESNLEVKTTTDQVSLPDDVWQRMRDGYKMVPSQHPKVIGQIRWYKSHPEHIDRLQERARPYIYFILEELEKREMPAEIALLPAVESAFQPFAYSK